MFRVKLTLHSRNAATPLRRCCGITLIDMSVLLVFVAIALGVATLDRVRGQARDFAIVHGLELRQVLNAALVYRYQTGEWPLNSCSRAHAISSGDCNGDSDSNDADLSGLEALVAAGRLPNLQRYQDNLGSDGEWISLQPWSAATASVPATSGTDLTPLLESDSLRMETIVSATIERYASYIARLVPGTEVVAQGGVTRLVSTIQFGGYSDILLSQIFDAPGRATGNVFTNQLVIDRRLVLDAPQPGLLRLRPYIDGRFGGQVRVNLDGQRLGTPSDAPVSFSSGVNTVAGVSVDGAQPSTLSVNVNPAPALIFGVAALETLGSYSDSGDRVELRALPDRLQIVEGVTNRHLPDGLTPLRQSVLDDRASLRTLTIDPDTGALFASNADHPRAYFAFPGDWTTQSLVIDATAAASRTGELRTDATRTALLFGGVHDHPDLSPALFPGGAPAGVSTRAANAKEGDARVALALSARHYSGALPSLLGSLRGLLHEQLFLDEAPLVYPAGSASVRVQNLLDFCTLPGLLSLNGDVACSTPTGAGAMFPIASQANDADMVLPRLSLYFSSGGGVVTVGNGTDGRLELWADESSGHSGTVTREPGLHQRAAFSATGLSVGDYDSHANFSDARAPRAAIVHLGLAADTLLPGAVTIPATNSSNRSAWPVQLGHVGNTATPTTTLDVIDFGGSTTSGRTVSQLSQAGTITLGMPLGLWYGESNHPIPGTSGLQISTLQVQSIANLSCWACADSTAEGTTCPAPADTPRYACP